MCHCPITGINIPRFLISAIAGFAFLFGLGYGVHHVWLMPEYEATANLWRPAETMGEFFPYMIGTHALTALITLFVFTRHYEGKGLAEGLRFGVMIGLLMAVFQSAAYTWLPISAFLAGAWALDGLLKGIGLGLIGALLYRK